MRGIISLIILLLSCYMREQEQITPIEQYIIDYILALRTGKKLTQQDIASIIGVSRSFISDVEGANKPSKYNVRHINALADYFGMSPKDFMPQKPFPVDAPVEKVVKKTPVKKIPVNKVSVKKAVARKALVKKLNKKTK